MKPGRLLHITGDSRFGGAGRIIVRLGETAKAQGWKVDVLTTDAVFEEVLNHHGLGVVNLDVIRREIRPFWDFVGLIRLCSFLRNERYEIVHTHTSKAGFVGRIAARLAGVPVIVHTLHGFAFHERSVFCARLFYSALERIAARSCDRIVSVSEFHRDWALDLRICDSSKIYTISNGIADLPECRTPPSEIRRRLDVRNGDLFILTMSRLAPDKGLRYLLDAAALLLKHTFSFRIIIAGDGPARKLLEECSRQLRVTDHVTFLGFRTDISDLLAAADLVVLPSLREGLSITLLEAMAAGKSIVATNIGSHRELAAQAEMAYLVPPADAPALCEAILRVAHDRALMTQLGRAARHLFETRYTEERMLTRYTGLYCDMLAKKAPLLERSTLHNAS